MSVPIRSAPPPPPPLPPGSMVICVISKPQPEVNHLPLYHSTKLRANFCCCVNSVTCDLSVQHLFAVLLLLYQGRGETSGVI